MALQTHVPAPTSMTSLPYSMAPILSASSSLASKMKFEVSPSQSLAQLGVRIPTVPVMYMTQNVVADGVNMFTAFTSRTLTSESELNRGFAGLPSN